MKCVEMCVTRQMLCKEKECKFWIDYPEDLSCALLSIEKHGAMPLVEVGKRLGVSHVRIKQIQDKAIKKMNKKMIDMLQLYKESEDMKSYNVKIIKNKNCRRDFVVKVEDEEDFIEWFNILSLFEKGDIVFSEIEEPVDPDF